MVGQLLLNGVVAGSAYALIALGFGLIFYVAKFFHFAHGGVYLIGVYSLYAFLNWLPLSPWSGIPLAISTAVLVGCGLELVVYRPLRQRGASSLILLLASLGCFIFIQNTVSLVFGNSTLMIRQGAVQKGIDFWGARITQIRIITFIISVLLSLFVWTWLNFTAQGKKLRAVASDPELSRIFGIDSDWITLYAFAIGSALAAVAAILIGYDTDLTPMMGFNALLMGVVAVVVGGVGSVLGSLLGGLTIGIVENMSVWMLPSGWQEAIVFLVLVLVLWFRPEGFLGKPLRKTSV